MQLWVAIGLIFLGLLIGSAGFKHGGRIFSGAWRPGASMLALVLLVGAVVAAELKVFPAAIVLFAMFVWMALKARRRPARPAQPPPPPRAGMSLEDAASTLGVAVDASEEEIQAAYVRLMRLVHPDRGGATGLAVQLNRAREMMLKARR
jgi:hypothetical protein